jgi:hypothetical protein
MGRFAERNGEACLCTSTIGGYQSSSMTWNWMMRSIHSDFKDVCADIPRKCFAVILDHCAHGQVLVRVYELILNKWHTFEITVRLDRSFHTMMASDGG